MTVAEDDEEYVNWRDSKVPYLKYMTGGKGPPEEPPGDDWLSKLELRTQFACRVNNKAVDWEMYFLYHKFTDIYLLKMETPDGRAVDRRVDPVLFSNMYRDYRVIHVYPPLTIEELEAPEGDDNGNSNRPD